MHPSVARGLLIGSSLGVFAALAGIADSMPRAFVAGGLAGLLAGLTGVFLRRNRRPPD
jgi:LPXTG-motif cell wall-anchored protein